jgi:hypothetical protein
MEVLRCRGVAEVLQMCCRGDAVEMQSCCSGAEEVQRRCRGADMDMEYYEVRCVDV